MTCFSLDFWGLDPEGYSIAIKLFVRCLGALYIVVYWPFLFQIQGLLGKEGIRPIGEYLEWIKMRYGKKGWRYVPTLFWLNSSDRAQLTLIYGGIGCGLLLLLGFYPAGMLFVLYIIHLSLTNAGQEFLSFGWETLLLEITLGALLTIATEPFNIWGWIGLNLLLLRFHIQAGASKVLSGDRNWRHLTALSYHYQTQPLPNTFAWYFHKLPLWFHKLTTLWTFYVELIVPLAIFSPPGVRRIVFFHLILLQMGIWLTGNLSYLNHLTALYCLILIHNQFLDSWIPYYSLKEPSSIEWQIGISLVGCAFIGVQLLSLIQPIYPWRWMMRILGQIEPFHIAYPHGLFAVMTTKRYEIVIEGSDDGHIWKEYTFYYKPQELSHRPKRVSPYQPRLDWQAWFLPFRDYSRQGWFQQFLMRLLQGTPCVVQLIKGNPFIHKPPSYIRVLLYDYEFTTVEEKARTGNWWKRRLVGVYAPALCLNAAGKLDISR